MNTPEKPFSEPWQAYAFALAVQLSQQGHFTWAEWADSLAQELAKDQDDGTRYYEIWLRNLEKMVVQKGLSTDALLGERKEAWADAYRHTPHGQPVVLE